MLQEQIVDFLMRHIGPVPYLLLVVGVGCLMPLFAMWQFVRILGRQRPRPIEGLRVGGIVAAWCSLCWLAVPYCGVYPNLPVLIAMSLFGIETAPVDALWKELLVILGNFLLWPAIYWSIILIVRWGNRVDAPAKSS